MEKLVKLNTKFDLRSLQTNIKSQAQSIPLFKIAVFALFFVVIAVVPMYLHTQWFTGPLVNAILIMTVLLVGPTEAILLGMIPSSVALSSGLLPLPLAPMVPFIIMGNAVFVAIFAYTQQTNYWLALVLASCIKFAFLSLAVSMVMSNMLADTLVQNLAIMMSWPQLVTALVGGVVAFGILKTVEKLRKT